MAEKILVLNGYTYGKAVVGLGTLVDDKAHFLEHPEQYKLVLFTGGADVGPGLYGDTSPLGLCSDSPSRDIDEAGVFSVALANKIKMTGICRGSQFLNVMCGGRMMHHVTNHGTFQGHLMYTHKYKAPIKVNTLHHQMSILGPKGKLIGWAEGISDTFIGRNDEPEEWTKPETEAIMYPEQLVCGVQYHPEMLAMETPGYKFFHDMIDDFLKVSIEEFTELYGEKQTKLLTTST